jgi:hypothetical protein
MIKFRKWRCPHGYMHTLMVDAKPKTGPWGLQATIAISAPPVCPWCTVSYRSVSK